MSIPQAQFEHECEQAVGKLRAALVQLFDSVRADPSAPQEVARQFGLNKTLTWNISRMLQAPDHIAAVPHVPGSQSLEKFVETIARHGADAEVVESVREAVRGFHSMIEVHVGDRSTFDLIVDSMSAPTAESLELSRKLAFRGNSGLYGVQARTRVVSCMVVPNAADPTRMDIASLSGYAGFRRLRASVKWPIFQVRTGSIEASANVTDLWDTVTSPSGVPASAAPPRWFGRSDPPDIQVVKSASGREFDYILMPGSVGESSAFECFRGEVLKGAAPRYRSESDRYGEFGANIPAPSENLVMDVLFPEDLVDVLAAEVLVFATSYAPGEPSRRPDDSSLLPIKQRPVELSGRPPAVATPLIPGYAELVRTMSTRLNVDPAKLRAIRVEMKYPPLGSMISLRFPLPAAPGA